MKRVPLILLLVALPWLASSSARAQVCSPGAQIDYRWCATALYQVGNIVGNSGVSPTNPGALFIATLPSGPGTAYPAGVDPNTCGSDPQFTPSHPCPWQVISAGTQVWGPLSCYQTGTPIIGLNGAQYIAAQPSGPAACGAGLTAIQPGSAEDLAKGVWSVARVVTEPIGGTTIAQLSVAAVQRAIDTAAPGGVVQLPCATIDFGTGGVVITKNLTLQGCGPGGMTGYAVGQPSTNLQSATGSTTPLITVNTIYGVLIRDLRLTPKTSGIYITTPGPLPGDGNINDNTIIERVWFDAGQYGILTEAGRVRGTMVSHSFFRGQTVSGVLFQGVSHTVCNPPLFNNPLTDCPVDGSGNPSGGLPGNSGQHLDNCDGGGYTLTDNIFSGDAPSGPTSDAMVFVNSAAVTLKGNATQAWGRHAVQFLSACYHNTVDPNTGAQVPPLTAGATTLGPAPTQLQIIGNQFEAGNSLGTSAIRIAGEIGGVQIVGNYLGATKGAVIDIEAITNPNDHGVPPFLGDIKISTNTIRSFGGPGITASSRPIFLQAGTQAASAIMIVGNMLQTGCKNVPGPPPDCLWLADSHAFLNNVTVVTFTGNTVGNGGHSTYGLLVSGGNICARNNAFGDVTTHYFWVGQPGIVPQDGCPVPE